jgi:hypothetical protein
MPRIGYLRSLGNPVNHLLLRPISCPCIKSGADALTNLPSLGKVVPREWDAAIRQPSRESRKRQPSSVRNRWRVSHDELIISDAITRAKSSVSRKGPFSSQTRACTDSRNVADTEKQIFGAQ